jgi:mycothiol synthase
MTLLNESFLNEPVSVSQVNPLTAPDAVIVEICRHRLAIWEERYPDDPKLPLEVLVTNFRNRSNETTIEGIWAIFDGSCAAAIASGKVELSETQTQTMFSSISVLPRYRRRGLATRLLEPLKEFARQNEKNTLLLESTDRVPAGAEFLQHIEAKPGFENHDHRLDLSKLDQNLMQKWIDEAKDHLPDFTLLFWYELPPDAFIDSYCQMMNNGIETQPSGSIEFPFQIVTPETVRERANLHEKNGYKHWILAAVETNTGQIVGGTEIMFHPNTSKIIFQGGTSVLTTFRNRGIGRWLKATMVFKLLEEVPEAHWINTDNADANAPMLKINEEMGFTPYQASCFWQYRFK